MQPVLTTRWTGRMEVIQVHARPHDLNKLPQCAASFGQGRFDRVSGCGR